MKLLRNIFFPVVPFYYGITWLRNKLYDSGIFESTAYDFPVICVGNLSVGGTGKTPMIEYLIRLLKADYKVSTLSRGYKRKTKGFQIGQTGVTADDLGDEPFQFYTKFVNDIIVAVDANRRTGISRLRGLQNPPQLILLDDAFQHRKVKAGFNILLTTYANRYTSDFVLPTGNLREPKGGAKRANVIVVTKCPDTITEDEKLKITSEIKPLEYQQVFFSRITYADEVVSANENLPLGELDKFTLVTGIANPKPLVNYLSKQSLDFEHLSFSDHHDFTAEEVAGLAQKDFLLTTEKDFMRLMQYEELKDKLYYLPIQVSIDNASGFNERILKFVNSY